MLRRLLLSGSKARSTHRATAVTLQDLGSLGEFIAAIATLATLIYLALQIRQNTLESQAASRNLVSQSLVDFAYHVSRDFEITKLTRRA